MKDRPEKSMSLQRCSQQENKASVARSRVATTLCDITDKSLDVGGVLSLLDDSAESDESGGLAIFIGRVRRTGKKGMLSGLWLEHYPDMTERAIQLLQQKAIDKWPLTFCHVSHRVGKVMVGESIVSVACSARHRQDAIEACHFLIDMLKTQAPFWKREDYVDGSHTWVSPTSDDYRLLQSWAGKVSESAVPSKEDNLLNGQ